MLARTLRSQSARFLATLRRGFSDSPYHPLAASVEVGQLLGRKSHGHGIAHRIQTVTAGQPVIDAVQAMVANGTGSVLITEGDHVAGILTERDYIRKLALQGKSSDNTLCSEVMTPNPFCVTPHNTLDDCIRWMVDNKARHLPVVVWKGEDQEQHLTQDLVGMLSIRDVVCMLHRLGASPQWQSLSQLTVGKALKDVSGKETVYTCKEDDTVLDAIGKMACFNVGSLIVNSSNQMSGIITERDYLTKVKVAGKNSGTTKVSEIMTSTPICIAPDYTLDQAMEIFKTKNFRHLPVVATDGADAQSDCQDLLSVTDILSVTGLQSAN